MTTAHTATRTEYYILHNNTHVMDGFFVRRWFHLDEAIAYANEQQRADSSEGTYRVYEDNGRPPCEHRVVYTTKPTRKTRLTAEEKQARAAEKKAAAHAEKLASLVVIGRATFKATSAVLFGVQSGEKIYHLTMIDGKIR